MNMKRMTETELDARIAQFMDRKREDFPGLFSRLDASQDAQHSSRLARHGFGSL